MKGIFIFISLLFSVLNISSNNEQQWTVESLKQYVDQRFNAIDKAVEVASAATEKRFENTNEWRKSYEDLIRNMQGNYVSIKEFESLKEKVENIKEDQDRIANIKVGGNAVVAYIISGVSVFVAMISIFVLISRKKELINK